MNYGDFIEYFGRRDETLDEIESRFKSDSTTDKSKLYMLSLYCGENYRFMAYESGAWTAQSGEMKQVDGKWQITGKVLNPVSGYELLTYDAMNWWQGVGSIDDMMEPTTAESSWVTKLKLGQPTYPMWTRYFECMIDDDQLQIDWLWDAKCLATCLMCWCSATVATMPRRNLKTLGKRFGKRRCGST